MKYLLDTCVLSELVRPSPDRHVLRWVESVDEQSLFISVLTVGEIASSVTKKAQGSRRIELERWLKQDLVERFSGRVLPVDVDVARVWSKVRSDTERLGRRLSAIDSLLAATALAHDLTLATRNIEDLHELVQSGVTLYSPWLEAWPGDQF